MKMVKGHELAISLEEFGLSKYEARAYVTLISKGTISAGELAYYSDLPRTKIYPTLLKLAKKKLVVISKTKPIICTSISPEDAFDELIQDQINKVNGMNNLVRKLHQVNENSKKARGSEEKRYFHLSPNYVLNQLESMIDNSKISIHAMVDSWALNLFSQCKDNLTESIRKNVSVKIIIPEVLIGSDAFQKIPNGVEIKSSEIYNNCVTFDDSEILMINSSNGKGAVFLSTEVMGINQSNLFERTWKISTKLNQLTSMPKFKAQETINIINLINQNGLNFILSSLMKSKTKEIDLIEFLKNHGVNLISKNINEIISLIDSTLQITCAGQVHYEPNGKLITLESKLDSGHSLPWAILLNGYLVNKGFKTKFMYHDKNNGEKVHIKLDSNLESNLTC